ncbi:hypothetical protein E2C01_081465 [Portunus trituberculatus]|uniref:Uncharacterized protein n=1 Tax=Portunus trituberculatus TaxID=210409 RepID=A0A5B7IPV7_PORTR|nr:hypothetical protein [Portunus trituberculatus]
MKFHAIATQLSQRAAALQSKSSPQPAYSLGSCWGSEEGVVRGNMSTTGTTTVLATTSITTGTATATPTTTTKTTTTANASATATTTTTITAT